MSKRDTIAVDVPNAKALSLHERILQDLEANIVSGRWPPGHRIPYEHELTDQYQCSRMTVNKAVTQLMRSGLVQRRRKSGTYVTFPKGQSAVLEIQDIPLEVEARGQAYRYELLGRSEGEATEADRRALPVERGDTVLKLQSRHFAGNRPFCLEDRMINLAAVPDASGEAFDTVAPGHWLLEQVPWSAAENRIRAIAANVATAKLLDIKAGDPCLVIERRTWSGDSHITHVLLTYPGDYHELVAQFTPAR
ncbi:histidine utilization repressor [Rhizobiaceae bacterium n13]|uniref:Histidine utilization repressor n=1 Tax=Ferirhizobium litorale TaxID=2927786 RepID=A0AAE3Q7P6_9HYPH|nr:histidine utilization repressor [Fererhizobium litorale]MDI7860619.1 histidine utilization repressor [Fererhizobium litorale]MDI7920767.1 histidine utilization repressor [Fererhizobium litorale]